MRLLLPDGRGRHPWIVDRVLSPGCAGHCVAQPAARCLARGTVFPGPRSTPAVWRLRSAQRAQGCLLTTRSTEFLVDHDASSVFPPERRFNLAHGLYRPATPMTPILRTERLTLRQFDHDDLHDLAAMVADEEQMRFYPRPKTRDEASAWITRNLGLYRERGFGVWRCRRPPFWDPAARRGHPSRQRALSPSSAEHRHARRERHHVRGRARGDLRAAAPG
jgi:hypothetical protein